MLDKDSPTPGDVVFILILLAIFLILGLAEQASSQRHHEKQQMYCHHQGISVMCKDVYHAQSI